MYFNNETCAQPADEMSCDAQIELAKMEVQRNKYVASYATSDPACTGFGKLADRSREYTLIKSEPTGLKFCVTMPTPNPDGEWTQQFGSLLGNQQAARLPTAFDQWTKARASGCKNIRT